MPAIDAPHTSFSAPAGFRHVLAPPPKSRLPPMNPSMPSINCIFPSSGLQTPTRKSEIQLHQPLNRVLLPTSIRVHNASIVAGHSPYRVPRATILCPSSYSTNKFLTCSPLATPNQQPPSLSLLIASRSLRSLALSGYSTCSLRSSPLFMPGPPLVFALLTLPFPGPVPTSSRLTRNM